MRVGWKPRVSRKRVASIAGSHSAKSVMPLPNRRVPNGMHGGVGGRGLATPSYPIHWEALPLPTSIMHRFAYGPYNHEHREPKKHNGSNP